MAVGLITDTNIEPELIGLHFAHTSLSRTASLESNKSYTGSESECVLYIGEIFEETPVNSEKIPQNHPAEKRSISALVSNPWIPYVGDFKALDDYLGSKTEIGWLLPKFINALLRGVGQVVFANNPLTGLLILIALFWCDVIVGLAAVAAASTAIITALLMKQDLGSIQAGLTTYNAVLVGAVTASLWTPLYAEPITPKLWVFIILGSVLSVFVNSALGNILSKWSLPSLTLPFNVVTLLLFTCLMPPLTPQTSTGLRPLNDTLVAGNLVNTLPTANFEPTNETDVLSRRIREAVTDSSDLSARDDSHKVGHAGKTQAQKLDWGKILSGTILSMGQVFAVETLFGSILMYIAILICSPVLCLMGVVGAFVGTLGGILFTTEGPYTAVYSGIWGYNGIIAAGAVGGFFFPMNCHSFWTAIMNVVFTVLVQHGLAMSFQTLRIPVFTMPFVLSTFLFLSVTASGHYLTRVTNPTFPEMHRYEYLEALRAKRQPPDPQVPENKGLTSGSVITERAESDLLEVASDPRN